MRWSASSWRFRQGRAAPSSFEERETKNDVSPVRNYLAKDLIEDLDLCAKEDDEWVIVEKDWEKVRDGVVANDSGQIDLSAERPGVDPWVGCSSRDCKRVALAKHEDRH